MRVDWPVIEVDSLWGLKGWWYSNRPCVYEIVIGSDNYVGKARRMRSRLGNYHPYAPRADLIRIHAIYEPEISNRELLNEEAHYVKKLKPTLNQAKTFIR